MNKIRLLQLHRTHLFITVKTLRRAKMGKEHFIELINLVCTDNHVKTQDN